MSTCATSPLIGLQVGCSGTTVETLSYDIWGIPVLSCRWSFGLCEGCCVTGTVLLYWMICWDGGVGVGWGMKL
jgi:hypothetical protein